MISDKNIDRMVMLVRELMREQFYQAEDLEEAENATRILKKLEGEVSDAALTEALDFLAARYEI